MLKFKKFPFLISIFLFLNCTYRSSSMGISERAKPHFEKGVELFERGDYEGALIHLERALLQDSLNPLIHYWMGRTYIELGKPEKADVILRRSLELKPSRDLREKIEREILHLSEVEPQLEEREEEITPEEME